MCFKMMGKTVQTVQETFEMEDQNVQVSADQNVQENAPDDEATQSKKIESFKVHPSVFKQGRNLIL